MEQMGWLCRQMVSNGPAHTSSTAQLWSQQAKALVLSRVGESPTYRYLFEVSIQDVKVGIGHWGANGERADALIVAPIG